MSDFFQQESIPMSFTKEAWVILNPIEQSIRNKIEKYGVPLKDWDVNIYRGILTGCNEAFIIDGAKRAELIAADPKSDEIIRPILRGRDIKRYGYDFANLYMICTFPSKDYNIENYPAVKDWLINGDWVGEDIPVGAGKLRLEQTGKEHLVNGVKFRSRKKTNNKWFETQDSIGYWNDFSKQKIVYPCIMAQEPCFMLDELQHFPPAPGNIITGQHLKYLLGFLCSKVCYFALREFYMGGGIEGELKTNRLLILPVPKPSEKEPLYDELVSTLIEYKQLGTDISDLDSQIEELVAEAYHLTDEEVDFIHNKSFARK